MWSDARRNGIFVLIGGLLFLGGSAETARAQSTEEASPTFFETRVRPILANKCYSCHTDSALGGLRLDSPEAMAKGGNRGSVVVPGDPEKSLLIQAVRHENPDLKMPMGGGKLKDSEIADLTAWVKAGAVWPARVANVAQQSTVTGPGKYVIPPERRNFWSFIQLNDPPLPQTKDAKWGKTPIDRFVLARLEKEGLKPVRPATKHDLLRRATLDLTGIPPTPSEYEAFENDKSPDAFARVVDRLLASPHYGERWGRVWLDVARFAEEDVQSLTFGGRHPYPNAYLYRDWVVQAMNDDVPYDQFVKAQIAGDLMDPNIRPKMIAGTGFLGLGPWSFDITNAETARAQERHEAVDAITRGFLGLTVACARCHNHKYDPIPQTDYYALAGVFRNTSYHDYPQVPKSMVEQKKRLEEVLEKKQEDVRSYETELARAVAESFVARTTDYLMGVWEATNSGQKKELSDIVESRQLDYEVLERWIAYMSKPTTWHRQKDAWQVMMKRGGGRQEAKKLAQEFQASVERVMLAKRDLDAENQVILDKSLKGTVPDKRPSKPSDFKTNEQFCIGCSIPYKRLAERDFNFWLEIFQQEIPPEGYDPYIASIGLISAKPGPLAFRGWALQSRSNAADWARLVSMRHEVDSLKKQLGPAYPSLDGVADNDTIDDLELNIKGSPFNLGPKVPRHFLSVLSEGDPKPFINGSGRLELAEAVVKQPIAMRVIVNRIWREHMGTGLVETPSNFGMTGERPTNPELLEYLAYKFVHDGMSIKKLHREVMLSATYQLSTEQNDTDAARDEGNRLYWRANQRRMTAEQLRDSVLAVSGGLDDAIGGPSESLTPTYSRRTIYGTVSRFKLDSYLQTFDYPNPASSTEKRFTTTVPLQRLFLMNSDFVQMRAEELARTTDDLPSSRERIRKIYIIVYGREPSPTEVSKGLEYLRTEPLLQYEERLKAERERVASDTPVGDPVPLGAEETENAGMMSGVGGPDGSPSTLRYEATVWGRYVKILLGSSEFTYIN